MQVMAVSMMMQLLRNLGSEVGRCPPVLIQIFGPSWFETGNLSLSFKNPTIDREKVQVFAETLSDGGQQTRVWMERDDGLLVCEGTAAVGDHSQSALRTKDLRPCDPDDLKVLNQLHEGLSLGRYDVFASPKKQFDRFDKGLISDPLNLYRTESQWGGVIACPATFLEFLWAYPMKRLGELVGDSVGLFGALEIGHVNGPFLLNKNYVIESEVVCVGQSPQTEYVWYDAWASNENDELVATLRIQSRAMKASSKAYG